MQWLDPILDRPGNLLTTVEAIVMGLMALHVVAYVLSKWLFNYPLDGTLEIVGAYYMVGLLGLFAFLALGVWSWRFSQLHHRFSPGNLSRPWPLHL
jgi:hypothetical protein